MKYIIDLEIKRADSYSVEASSLDEAIELAKSGKGESLNEGQVEIRAYGRPFPDYSTLATRIRPLPDSETEAPAAE